MDKVVGNDEIVANDKIVAKDDTSGLHRQSRTAVLLVEEDAPLRRVLAETLEFYGYDVISAASGKVAVEKLERERIGVVVCDVYLPGNGISVLAASRAAKAGIPVILISVDSNPATSRRAHELGAARLLLKPVTGPELRDAIEELSP